MDIGRSMVVSSWPTRPEPQAGRAGRLAAAFAARRVLWVSSGARTGSSEPGPNGVVMVTQVPFGTSFQDLPL